MNVIQTSKTLTKRYLPIANSQLRILPTQHRFIVYNEKVRAPSESKELVGRRKQRPISPHLTIYEPQIPWVLSALHRITGIYLGLIFFSCTILLGVSSIFNLDISTKKMKDWYKRYIPTYASVLNRILLSYFVSFHSFNGIRHLVWDTGRQLSNQGVIRTGYVVIGLSTLVGTYLLSI
ncbi:hypothetical protein KAFR_0A00490 [Kazachstania africana CBS 2517]|uniref:Uncharacterized protein n=1 Tax=Kazachstania africana (strain ATCC 22294 / BCRC 22015 / CBS 2517 / CECT 1963 / NBRC 1671 / NRRL Y-8276) TaxID=1071382 RepID=H2AM87_KAZAF|nr:hypothetical protein KAFR_0A00490 [Kazachstania africana CBS 2517]CCF55487.1 hypothetical protein KAFR_0A00490 [Kazachstania africana CBS 2517]